jgi:hypothetical protein
MDLPNDNFFLSSFPFRILGSGLSLLAVLTAFLPDYSLEDTAPVSISAMFSREYRTHEKSR